MATLKKKVSRIYKDFDMSFNVNATTGDLMKKLDDNAVKQSIKNLMLTERYERPFQPEIGSGLYTMLFEPMDLLVAQSMKKQIHNMITNFEPRVEIKEIQVTPDYDQNYYGITLRYKIRGVNEPQELQTKLTRLR
tara:strand:+ start:7842 stop:8246 length:405 start_codon:yes stop_codon:yes gene_type:complete